MLNRKAWSKTLGGSSGQAKQIEPPVPVENVHPGAADIERWMVARVAETLNIKRETLDPAKPFTSYGLDSIAGYTLTLDLAEWLDRELPASLLWEYPTIQALAEHLGDK